MAASPTPRLQASGLRLKTRASNVLRCAAFFFTVACSPTGWSAEPTLSEAMVRETGSKISKIVFLYQEKNLVAREPALVDVSRPRRGFLGDVQFPTFGDVMVSHAVSDMASLGVATVHAGFMPEGKGDAYIEQLSDMLGPEEMRTCSYVVITPDSARTTGNGSVTSAEVVFSVRVIGCNGGKLLWSGWLHTQTRAVKTALARVFERKAEVYDEAYARSMLTLLVGRWRRDGLL